MLPGRPPVSASSVVTVGSTDVTGIRLEPGEISLDGTVRTDDASAAQVRYISVESDRYNAGAPVGADGKFHIPNLRAGTYRIVPQIFATQTCLQSVLSGGHDIRDGLTITSGVAPDAIEMTISTHCGSIDVGLPPSDNLPPNLAANLMRKAGNQLVLEKQGYPGPVSSDGTRHFLIQGVAPGDYTVYIWPGDASIEYANPEYMRQLDSYGQNVTVTADSSTPVTIDKPLLTIPKN